MKLIILFVAANFPLIGLAMPNIGDSATFRITKVEEGQTVTSEIEKTVTAISVARGVATFRTTERSGENAKVSEEETSLGDFPNEEMMAGIFSNCDEMGGTLETVTVPAGDFATCALTIGLDDNEKNQQTTWFARGVPLFGDVKIASMANGNRYLSELLSFKTSAP